MNLKDEEHLTTLTAEAPRRGSKAAVRSVSQVPEAPYKQVDESAWSERETSFADLAIIIRKRIWIVTGTFLLVWVLGMLYAYTRVPIYRSEATVKVGQEHKESIKNLGEAAVSNWWNQDEVYATEAEVLKSRPIAEALVETVDLMQYDEFSRPERPSLMSSILTFAAAYAGFGNGSTTAPITEEARKRSLVAGVLSRVSARRQGKTHMLRLGMEARDPVVAKELLDAYLTLYLKKDLAEKRRPVNTAATWLKVEVETAEKKLVDSLAQLVKFTSEHGVVAMDGEANHVLKFFNKAAEGLVRSKENRVHLEAMKVGVGQSGPPVLPYGVERGDVSKMREKLSLLESEYSQLQEIYSENYPKLVLMKKQIAFLREKVAELESGAVSSALDAAEQQEKLQQDAFERAKKTALESKSDSTAYAVLKKEVETNERLYNILLEKSKEMDLNTQIVVSRLTVVDPPSTPVSPVKPKKRAIMMAVLLMGLVGGISAAFVVEHFDDKIRSTDDVTRKIGLWTLGEVPDVNKLRRELSSAVKKGSYEFLPHDSPRSPVSDAIRNLKLAIFLSAPASTISSIAVCSSLPSEGKTFIAVSVATAMATSGKRVLLIDTDLRRRGLTRVFEKRTKSSGLSSVLSSNEVKLESVVKRSHVPGLYYIPAGPVPPNPPGLLESARMARVVRQLKKAFDMVIFDCPPVVGLPDAQIVLAHVDAAVLVARMGYVPFDLVRQARDRLTATKRPILGVVLNMSDKVSPYYRKYKYYKYYS
ncbi:MAG: polysaccharide biosynthesis tyrosine autokinase [Thermodesulfobacteriota bacterium]